MPHEYQVKFIDCNIPRVICRAGRRSGKTTGVGILAVRQFLSGKRILYCAPTQEQVGRFWTIVNRALFEPIKAGVFVKNETMHSIALPGTEQLIRAKTAFNADSLRGDYADLLIIDEWQLCDEEMWETVGAPMMLDRNGRAYFIYTPPSLRSRSVSKARDPLHAAKMFKMAQADKSGRWAAFHFSSHDNPYISKDALADITKDMTSESYQAEILALDVEDAPGALWKRENIDSVSEIPRLNQIAVGVDPHGGATECGIVAVGSAVIAAQTHIYVLDDVSTDADEATWGKAVVGVYNKLKANVIAAEANFGGTMVGYVIKTVPGGDRVHIELVTASRGKDVRAEPIVAIYQQGRGHHVGHFYALENEMCQWVPGGGMPSPNRLDALVWAATKLTQSYRGARGT